MNFVFNGFGVLRFPISFNYNYVPYGDLGDSHMVSIGVRF